MGSSKRSPHDQANNAAHTLQGFAELAFSATRFPEENRIGSAGSYGTVFRSEFDSVSLAVKVSKHSNSQREIEILSTCEHPNIIGLLGWSLQGSCYYLVLELMQYDLDNRLKSHLFGSWFFPCSERVAALRDVAAALKFLPGHTPCVYHRDVKSANVLLKDSLLGSSEDYETWNIS